MNLRDLRIIYNKTVEHPEYGVGTIDNIYAIYKDNKVTFCVEVKYIINDKSVFGLFGIDLLKGEITSLSYYNYLWYLKNIIKIDFKIGYFNIYKMLKKKKYDNCQLYDINCFITINNDKDLMSYESDSYCELLDNGIKVKPDIAILHTSSGLSTSYFEINEKDYNKNNFGNIDLSTNVEVFIKYNNDYYSEFGNIMKTLKQDKTIGFIIEPVETTLLNNIIPGNINFQNITPLEIVRILMNQSKVTKLDNELPNKNLQKYRYITFLQNVEIEKEELIIGEMILSKRLDDVNFPNMKLPKNKFVYVTIYTSAKNIADAINISQKKIKNILNFVELTQKNSTFFELYDKKEDITNWDINNLFVDYKVNPSYLIYNVLNPKQVIYNDFSAMTLKKIANISKEDNIIKYYEELEKILYLPNSEVDDLYESIYWLNKGLESINYDLNRSVIYLNIACEYVTKGEKGESFIDKHPEIKKIKKPLKKYLKENIVDEDIYTDLIGIVMGALNDTTLPNRFECMLRRLDLNFSENEISIYNKMRKARNAIVHKEYKIEVFKHDIIIFYIMLSKIIFVKMVKESNENI
ncbi:MAG: hypothetical protein E7159_04940 [Firmicutes bacterium]|nr:hypothetical protein [Bacillota bacterium]